MKGSTLQYIAERSRDGMSEEQWRESTRFDGTDWGWVIMSIGMAIGAGIVFLPVKVGLVGLWVFLASSVIAYPAMYLFQRLFINTLAESPKGEELGILSRRAVFHHVGDLGLRVFDRSDQ